MTGRRLLLDAESMKCTSCRHGTRMASHDASNIQPSADVKVHTLSMHSTAAQRKQQSNESSNTYVQPMVEAR